MRMSFRHLLSRKSELAVADLSEVEEDERLTTQ